LHQLLSECALLFALPAKERGLPIKTEIMPNVPCWMVGDSTRVRQMIINMLGNAYKFTERGAVTLRAYLREDKGKTAYLFSLKYKIQALVLLPNNANVCFSLFRKQIHQLPKIWRYRFGFGH
jgi:signal transduction histidine kinase